MKDASNEYFPEGHVGLDVHEKAIGRWGYLCVFTGAELKPIAVSEFRGKRIEFADVEPDMIYFPAIRRTGRMEVFGYPFLLKGDSVEYFIPDATRKHSVTLTRKYPLRGSDRYFRTAVGVRIEGANRKDFRDAELLYQIVDTPRVNYNILYPIVQKRFRYVRYAAPDSQRIQLGEWHVYGKDRDKAVVPKEIWNNQPLTDAQRKSLRLLMDGDWSSYYASDSWGEQVVYDLGTPQLISSFLLILRNDDNFIHLGDLYELFYHAGSKGWVSLGKQTADSWNCTTTEYPKVPCCGCVIIRAGRKNGVFT